MVVVVVVRRSGTRIARIVGLMNAKNVREWSQWSQGVFVATKMAEKKRIKNGQ
jgi:hypothetical protein